MLDKNDRQPGTLRAIERDLEQPRKEVAAMKRYTAIFERDESGSWLARIPSIRGCHTYGRTLEQARTRLREALGLWIDRPEHAVIEETIRLPADLRTAIQRSRRTRERAEREHENAQEQTRAAAEALVDEGVSLRDAGELLGLSHQRVQQLVQAQ